MATSNTGIINAAANPTDPAALVAPVTTPVSTYAPTQSVIDPSKTVQGRLAGLMDPNDPFNQAATTTAKQTAAASGMLNSSMASTGATDAVIKNAMNIATPDAQLYSNNQQFNANAANVAGATNAGAQNTAGLQANQLGYDAAKTNAQQGFNVANAATAQANVQTNMGTQQSNNLQTMSAQQVNDLAKLAVSTASSEKLAQLSSDTQKYVSNQSSATQQAIAGMNNASQQAVSAAHDANSVVLQNSAGAQSLFNSYLNDIASINSNSAISDKTAAITNVGAMMQQGMDAYSAGKMPDVSPLLAQMQTGTVAPPASLTTPAAPAARATPAGIIATQQVANANQATKSAADAAASGAYLGGGDGA